MDITTTETEDDRAGCRRNVTPGAIPANQNCNKRMGGLAWGNQFSPGNSPVYGDGAGIRVFTGWHRQTA